MEILLAAAVGAGLGALSGWLIAWGVAHLPESREG